jgi:GntR family transcriptional regulator
MITNPEIINGRSSTPKYVQLGEWLRGMIEKGRYSLGGRIPSEIKLSHMFGINRNTVRQAIFKLVEEGLLTKINGVGTFVSSNVNNKVTYPLKNITSLSYEFTKLGIKSKTVLVSKKIVVPPDDLSEKLMLGKDRRAIQIKRVRYGNGMPLVLERSYYSYKEFKKILSMDIPDSLYSTLVKTFGATLDHSIQTLMAVALPDKDAMMLGVEPGFPATLQESIIYDVNNIVVEVLHSCYRGDKFVFKVESGKFSPTI